MKIERRPGECRLENVQHQRPLMMGLPREAVISVFVALSFALMLAAVTKRFSEPFVGAAAVLVLSGVLQLAVRRDPEVPLIFLLSLRYRRTYARASAVQSSEIWCA